MPNIKTLLLAAALTTPVLANAALITFEENPLPTDTFYNPQASASFNSGGVDFQHDWSFGCCWGNFTYSNRTDTTTPGFLNDRSAIAGSGANGSAHYGVSFGSGAYIDFGQATSVGGMSVTNTTYTYLSMRDGDLFARQFEAGDYFRVIVNGLGADGGITSSTQFSLAEGRDIVNDWTSVDLSSLGTVHGLSFDYLSTDIGSFGINTPTYFAVDDIKYQTVPEPGLLFLLLPGVASLALIRRRHQSA